MLDGYLASENSDGEVKHHCRITNEALPPLLQEATKGVVFRVHEMTEANLP